MSLFQSLQNQIGELFRKSQRFEQGLLPMGRLFTLDRKSFQTWSAKIYAIDASFGRMCRREMSRLFVKLAQSDPTLSRHMIHVLPDRMVKASPSLQMKYLSILYWVCEENPAAVDLFSDVTPRLMLRLSQEKMVSFLSEGLELFLRNPKRAEAFLRMQSSEGQKSEQELQNKTQFDSIRRMLTLYARGHCGEDVRIYPCGDKAYTDGQHIYLPEYLQLGTEVNMLAYRVLTARCAGYLEFGTLDLHVNRLHQGTQWRERRENEVELERFFRSFQKTGRVGTIDLIRKSSKSELYLCFFGRCKIFDNQAPLESGYPYAVQCRELDSTTNFLTRSPRPSDIELEFLRLPIPSGNICF